MLRRLAAASLVAFLLCASARAGISLREEGAAAFTKVTTLHVEGTPGDGYLVILSLSGGPTQLPPPHLQDPLDVGLELLALSFQIPGFFGTIPASGDAAVPLFFPPDPALDPLVLHLQALRHDNVLLLEKSNPCILTPNFPTFPEFALGEMPVRRAGHTVTRLPDGRLVFIGGGADGIVASFGQTSIDVYDPCTQTFEKVGDLLVPRTSHTATLLPDGRILVAGGADAVLGEPVSSAEIVDPAAGFVSTMTANSMSQPRALHTASLLPDGRVLIAGGTSSFQSAISIVENATASTEIFDPTTSTFSAGPPMNRPRVGHTATTLLDQRVLVAGGYSWTQILFVKVPFITDDAELYTPSSGPGAFGSTIQMTGDRFGHAAALRSDGSVLLFGGAQDQLSDPFNPITVNTVERFDPQTQTFSAHGQMSVARGAAAVVPLPGDLFLVAGGATGGLNSPVSVPDVDLYDGTNGFSLFTFQMNRPRANFSASLLENGAVLLAGGGEEPNPNDPAQPLSWKDAEVVTLP